MLDTEAGGWGQPACGRGWGQPACGRGWGQPADGLLVPTFGEGSRVSSPHPGVRTENVQLSQVQMKVTSNASCLRKGPGQVQTVGCHGLDQPDSTQPGCHPVKAPQRVAPSPAQVGAHTHAWHTRLAHMPGEMSAYVSPVDKGPPASPT